MREWREDDRDGKRFGHSERAVKVFAPDVVDELAIFGVPLEHLGAHEIDERGRVRRQTEEAAAGLDLHDLDALVAEHAAIVERLRAHHAHIVTSRGEPGRELVGEALRSADARVCTLREKDLHRKRVLGKESATLTDAC